jgi:hypothetical protein
MPQSFAEQLRSIPMSPNLGQSLERAHRSARDQSHRLVTLEHLLLALTEDTEAALILQSANVDLARLSTDVSAYLGGLLEDMRAEPGTEPRPDAELLRVLQAAASAAQQSRRKQIDGAIVLAAVVGDGKSPAAGLLKALGMTFEEAIRALQRANTKARLKPIAKAATAPAPEAPAALSSAPSAPAPPPAPSVPPASAGAPTQPAPASAAKDAPAPDAPLAAQSADEILAAARARIQKRATASVAKTEPSTPHRAPPAPSREAELRDPADLDLNPEVGPIDPAQTKSLTAAIEAAMASSGARGASLLPPTKPSAMTPQRPEPSAKDTAEKKAPVAAITAAPARPARMPPAELASATARAPQAPPARPVANAVPGRPVQPGEGPRRPPLPQFGGQPAPPQPGFPNRPARVPWPETGDTSARPPLANGSLAGVQMPPPHGTERAAKPVPPPPGWPMPGPRGGPQAERALLAESIPRRMRVGAPAAAEVRVARAKVDSLIAALSARAPHHSDAALARALAVRLGAPQGGFAIEPTGPEVQWIDSSTLPGQDEFITWHWTVVPQRRGRKRLTLTVSGHSIGRDGGISQSALPERMIEVKVGANPLRRVARLAGWIILLSAGVLIGRYWQELLLRALATFGKVMALFGA